MSKNERNGEFAAFLSYVRSDDDHDDGRITGLRRRLEAELGMQMGEAFPIFQDRDDILVGQRWRDRIQSSIDGTTFLVAIITPSFLRSKACIEEVTLFRDREAKLGRDDLVVPVLYLPTPGLFDEANDIAVDLSGRQYFDWADLRFEDPSSNEVRKATAALAAQMISALERSRAEVEPPQILVETVDEGPGFVEVLAESEEAMPLFSETIVAFGQALTEISTEISNASDDLNDAGQSSKPSAARLRAVHKLTKKLEVPVVEMERLASDYLDQLTRVDGGINVLVRSVPDLTDPDELRSAGELLQSLNDLADGAAEGLDSLDSFRETLAANYHLSSTLRPTLKRMSAAVSRLLPSREMFRRWRDELAVALPE